MVSPLNMRGAKELTQDFEKRTILKVSRTIDFLWKLSNNEISFKKVNTGDVLNEPSTEPPKFICLLVSFDSQKAEVSFSWPDDPLIILPLG